MSTAISTQAVAAAQILHPVAVLGQPERAFLALADASPAMIWIADSEGRWVFANQTWLEFRGRSLEQELGFGWTQGLHPQDRPRWQREYQAAFATGQVLNSRFQMLTARGAYQDMESIGQPWKRPDGSGAFVGSLTALHRDDIRGRDTVSQLASLTERERQVLTIIALGHPTKEVAAKLGVSYKTADSHRTHILKKLGFHETASLVRFAVRAGLITA